ncbi:MAG TPA: class E sortase [Actinomycetota bacterium]|nr:class E sortase [Actinomycetota bacterium]
MVRRLLRGTGWTFIGMGSFVLYFLVYQLVGTNAVTSRGQSDLRNELQREWTAAPPVAANADPEKIVPRRVPQGKALAVIDIPKIKLDNKVIVEGVGRNDLRKGPGHVPSTALPGQAGTFGVSGHRTTYGAPFYRLNELAKGDTITVVTREAIYTYTVTRTAIVRPTDTQVLDNVIGPDDKPKATITLTTCHPRYSARQRLIVFGDLMNTSTNNSDKVAA